MSEVNWAATGIDTITWIDVETTGLDAGTNLLLEIAVIVTDGNLTPLDKEGFHAYVRPERPDARDLAVPYVQEMHDKTGLWDKIYAHGETRTSIDYSLAAYLRQFSQPMTSPIGGNSVRLDANFIDVHLPQVAAHLSYRLIDVSTVRALEEMWWRTPPLEKSSDHTAMTDIRESIRELQYYRDVQARRVRYI